MDHFIVDALWVSKFERLQHATQLTTVYLLERPRRRLHPDCKLDAPMRELERLGGIHRVLDCPYGAELLARWRHVEVPGRTRGNAAVDERHQLLLRLGARHTPRPQALTATPGHEEKDPSSQPTSQGVE